MSLSRRQWLGFSGLSALGLTAREIRLFEAARVLVVLGLRLGVRRALDGGGVRDACGGEHLCQLREELGAQRGFVEGHPITSLKRSVEK